MHSIKLIYLFMFYETMYLVSVYTRINMCEHFPNFYAIIIHTIHIYYNVIKASFRCIFFVYQKYALLKKLLEVKMAYAK